MIARLLPPACAFALAALAVAPSAADEPADLADLGIVDDFDPLDALDVADTLALLAAEDVVISAARRLQRIDESPSAITVITREQILASGYDNLGDLMRLVPGANVYRITQAHVAVGLRSRSTWAGDRMLVLVDGRDVALHMWGQPQWMGMPFDMESVERIEVIRGPGSTLYGANALQGVVNIVTRMPADAPRVAEGTVGVAGRQTFAADARAHGRVGDWGYFAGAGFDRRSPYALPDETSFENLRGRLRLDWFGGDGIAARVETGLVHMTGDVSTYIGQGAFSSIWPYVLASVSLDRTEILAVVDWNETTMDMDAGLVLPAELDGPPLATLPTMYFPTRSAELAAHHTVPLFEGNELMVGGSARVIHHMPGTLIRCPATELPDFDPDECTETDVLETRFGVFVQDEWYLRDELLLNLGMRLDLNSLTPQPGLSPRAALVWRFRPEASLRLSYGRAYRKPSFSETDLSSPLDPDPSTSGEVARWLGYVFSRVGNRDLNNEYVDSLELGLRGRFLDDRLVASLDLFGVWFQDAILGIAEDLTLTPGPGGLPRLSPDARVSFVNYERPIVGYGGELAVTGRPTEWLDVSGAYVVNVVHIEDEDDETGEVGWRRNERWEPHHRVLGTVRLRQGGFRTGFDAIWMSRYATETRHPVSALAPPIVRTIGATTLVNGQVSYAIELPEERRFEVGLHAINLLGQPYREVGAYDEGPRALLGGERIEPRARIFVRGTF